MLCKSAAPRSKTTAQFPAVFVMPLTGSLAGWPAADASKRWALHSRHSSSATALALISPTTSSDEGMWLRAYHEE